MKRILSLAFFAVMSGTASFAVTPATQGAVAPTKAQIAQERLMTSGVVMNDMTTLWHQQDGHYENA